MAELRPRDYERRRDAAGGWPVEVICYRLGKAWVCEVTNLSPGARLVRREADSREAAEREALAEAAERLARTRVVE